MREGRGRGEGRGGMGGVRAVRRQWEIGQS